MCVSVYMCVWGGLQTFNRTVRTYICVHGGSIAANAAQYFFFNKHTHIHTYIATHMHTHTHTSTYMYISLVFAAIRKPFIFSGIYDCFHMDF